MMHIFSDVVQEGSFAACGRLRGIDPSQVSRAISRLEAELGLRLFHRTTRQLSLTQAGEIYLAKIQPALEEINQAADAARALSNQPQGKVRLTVSQAYGQLRLIPVLNQFRRLYPEISLDVIFSDDNLDLGRDAIDLAIRLAPQIEKEVICTKLHPTRYKIVASPQYIESCTTVLRHPEDLRNHDVLLLNLAKYDSCWMFRSEGSDVCEIPLKGSLSLSSPLALKQAMLQGLGPALLATWMVDEELEYGDCVELLPDYDVTATSFDTAAWLIYLNRKHLPVKTRVTIDFLKKRL